MLGKLLKYDLKWIYKVEVVFYFLAIFFSVMGRLFSQIENSVVFSAVTQFTFGFAISMMVSSLILCVMRLWGRFIKNLYKDESYLTHTLPVTRKTLYASKVISAVISIFTTTMVIIGCLLICYGSKENLQSLKAVLELAASTYDMTVINLLFLVCVIFFLEMIFLVLIGYVGIIFGHKSNQKKMVKTIIIGFGLYMLTQIATIGFIFVFGLCNDNVMNLINTTNMVDIEAIKEVMFAGIGLYVVYIIFYYIVGNRAFEKGVDVE